MLLVTRNCQLILVYLVLVSKIPVCDVANSGETYARCSTHIVYVE